MKNEPIFSLRRRVAESAGIDPEDVRVRRYASQEGETQVEAEVID